MNRNGALDLTVRPHRHRASSVRVREPKRWGNPHRKIMSHTVGRVLRHEAGGCRSRSLGGRPVPAARPGRGGRTGGDGPHDLGPGGLGTMGPPPSRRLPGRSVQRALAFPPAGGGSRRWTGCRRLSPECLRPMGARRARDPPDRSHRPLHPRHPPGRDSRPPHPARPSLHRGRGDHRDHRGTDAPRRGRDAPPAGGRQGARQRSPPGPDEPSIRLGNHPPPGWQRSPWHPPAVHLGGGTRGERRDGKPRRNRTAATPCGERAFPNPSCSGRWCFATGSGSSSTSDGRLCSRASRSTDSMPTLGPGNSKAISDARTPCWPPGIELRRFSAREVRRDPEGVAAAIAEFLL
jgi:hypothetical protein